jgi:hypothetical protein
MADRPILFSAPMVRALLAGTKTQTRRALKPVGSLGNSWPMYPAFINGKRTGDTSHPEFCDLTGDNGGVPLYVGNTPICPGDRLYVREHWRVSAKHDATAPRDLTPRSMTVMFEAGGSIANQSNGRWEPDLSYPPALPDWAGRFRQGMHMPRWASRITLTVTEVRVQRLQEISETDALAEGIIGVPGGTAVTGSPFAVETGGVGRCVGDTAAEAYHSLWNYINGPGSWDVNPWVAAYTFTVERGNIDQARAAA